MGSFGTLRTSGTVLVVVGGLLALGLILFGLLRFNAHPAGPEAPRPEPNQQISQLVTASRPVERGQLIQASDLKSTPVLGSPPAGALTALADAAGKIAIVDIQPQQLILSSLISSDPAAAGLAMLVPAGQRLLSIDTTDEIAVGGFLRPGDIVDVEIVLPKDVFGNSADGPDRSEARTLLQNIKVVTVGPTLGQPDDKNADGKDKPAQPIRTLTLAMQPEQVGPFTLARKLGQFFLLLRNPLDRAVVTDGRAGLANLRSGSAPSAASAPAARAPRPAAPPRAIELIVGGQRQIIYPGASSRR